MLDIFCAFYRSVNAVSDEISIFECMALEIVQVLSGIVNWVDWAGTDSTVKPIKEFSCQGLRYYIPLREVRKRDCL